MGTYIGGIIVIIAAFFLVKPMLGDMKYFVSIISGLIVGILIGK
jgi:K(+)-stimulated pyrophosphate-energized sodium pump